MTKDWFMDYAEHALRVIELEQEWLEMRYRHLYGVELRGRHDVQWTKDEHGRFTGSVSSGGGSAGSGGRDNSIDSSDEADNIQRLKNSLSGQGYKNIINDFEQQLNNIENADVKKILERTHKDTDYYKSDKKKSYYNSNEDKVFLTNNTDTSTVAHELFHKVDHINKISESGLLDSSIMSDYVKLIKKSEKSGQSIEDMLYLQYPGAFIKKGRMKPEYRGISDIIHGMTNGEVDLGYKHRKSYWEKPLKLQKETFAQYGRMLFEGNTNVTGMLNDIFPETTLHINTIVSVVANVGK